MHLSDVGSAADTDAYEFSNVQVSDDTVMWDSAWTDAQGAEHCAEAHHAVITDGKILTWTFGPRPENHQCG